MVIVFICGNLEPGFDGVGDYTRLLATELTKMGHTVALLAINDIYTNQSIEELKSIENLKIGVYRLPSKWKPNKKFQKAKKWLDHFNPQWISFQFVIYSFHSKGLPFGLGRHFRKLCEGRLVHIMFHEIWIGFTRISPMKHRIIGFIQKHIIKRLLHTLKPDLLTTTNGLYQAVLKKENIQSIILPLFSNIEIANLDYTFVSNIWERLSIPVKSRINLLIVGVFGNIYHGTNLEKAIASQISIASIEEKQLVFLGFGRANEKGLKEFHRLKIKFSKSVIFFHFGEQPSDHISQLFQIIDLGISCSPKQHLGKSGVFAAMKLHNLNVLIPNEEYIPEFNTDIRNSYDELIRRPAAAWNVTHVSAQFCELLKKSNFRSYD